MTQSETESLVVSSVDGCVAVDGGGSFGTTVLVMDGCDYFASGWGGGGGETEVRET